MSAPAPTSFAQKYGRARGGHVSFNVVASYTIDDLLVTRDDELDDIAMKLRNVRDIIDNGGSLAVAMDMLPSDGSMPAIIPAAEDAMSPEEREMWTDWIAGTTLPELDKDKDRKTVEPGKSKKMRDERRLLAIRRLYDNEDLTRENLAFFHSAHPYLIPLLTAAEKVIGLERASTNKGKRDPRELAELQASNKLLAAAASRQGAILERQNRLTKEISFDMGALQARRVAMQPEPEEGRKKATVRYDELRKARGKEVVGAPKKWNSEGSKGRRQAHAEELQQSMGTSSVAGGSRGSGASSLGKRRESEMEVDDESERAGPSRSRRRRAGAEQGSESPSYTPQSPPADDDNDLGYI